MNTCKTCKHWIPVLIVEGEWGTCEMTKSEGTTSSAKMVSSKAVAVDGESYYAELRTRPSFGCNQHEAKP